MKRLLIIPMLLVSSVVGACESFEQCLETGDNYAGHRSGPIATLEEVKRTEYVKAIAYKLDGIEKILEKINESQEWSKKKSL